jgi:superfamily I DNA/RNA helicase
MTAINTPEQLAALMGWDFTPSPEQWEAIRAPLGPAVVIAGAGSGKTTLMAARVVYLVATEQVRPDQVLGLTFTTKAAGQLRGKVREALLAAALLPEPSADTDDTLEPTVATYNAYAASLLTDHGLRIGHEPDTRVLSDASRYQLGARVLERHTAEVRFLTDHPPTAIQNLLALDSAMSEHLVSPERVLEHDAEALQGFLRADEAERAGKARKTYLDATAKAINAIERRRELMELVRGYRRLKHDLGLMDFSDQIELGARLAVEQPEVGAMERERFRIVLLDEYQDTSVAQATMLSRLFSGGHPVMAVGDPNQAIYGWRGASVSNILHFADTFPGATGTVATYPLSVSRRSDRRILDVANRRGRRGGGGDRGHPGSADARGRARLAGRRRAEHPRGRRGLVGHRRPHPRQRPRGGRLRRADRARRAGRDRGPVRSDPAARGGGGGRDPAPPQRRHRQRRPAHPAHRPALGGRSARPPPARAACSAAGRRRTARGRDPRRPADRDRRRHRPGGDRRPR